MSVFQREHLNTSLMQGLFGLLPSDRDKCTVFIAAFYTIIQPLMRTKAVATSVHDCGALYTSYET